MGRLLDPISAHPGHPRDVGPHVSYIQLTNTLNLLLQGTQDFIVNGSSKKFSEKYSR